MVNGMKIVIYDFEVFKYDILLGAQVYDTDNDECQLVQTWSIDEISKFYFSHNDYIWIGHNNYKYDDYILSACISKLDCESIKRLSDVIVNQSVKMRQAKYPEQSFDLMNCHNFYSLKAMEAYMGKSIIESNVSFDIDRSLTDDEKKQTEYYNQADLQQTFDDFFELSDELSMRLEMHDIFQIDGTLRKTSTQIAEKIFKPQKIVYTDNDHVITPKRDSMIIKNTKLLDYYYSDTWKTAKRFTTNFGDCEVIISGGGIHGSIKKYHYDGELLYADVSGYYNLLMILYDLYPRPMQNDESKKIYIDMYHEQLRLKKINPTKRIIYKTMLLCVWGAMKREYSNFYDPETADLLLITGQLFLYDLCEKLYTISEIVQINTDGVIVQPRNCSYDDVANICKEWQERTGFVLKINKIYNVHQRDVNNYMYCDENQNIITCGEAVTHYERWQHPFIKNSYSSKEPIIISYMIVQYFMKHMLPEETLEQYKHELRMFQFIVKKGKFDYMTYEYTDNLGISHIENLQNVNRAFASNENGMIYKNDKQRHVKVSNLSEKMFVYNDSLDNMFDEIYNKIDFQYYIDRGYERIAEFIDIPKVRYA